MQGCPSDILDRVVCIIASIGFKDELPVVAPSDDTVLGPQALASSEDHHQFSPATNTMTLEARIVQVSEAMLPLITAYYLLTCNQPPSTHKWKCLSLDLCL